MNNEINSLNENKTWKLVNKPTDKKAIEVKWVYKQKDDKTFKARLVARGFQQENCYDDIYSPVSKMHTFKILLAYCCKNNLHIEQMDVETAFLNGRVKGEVYVQQPPGYNDGSGKVYKLYRSLYGLKESPRQWYECINKFLIDLNFIRCKVDYCLYYLKLNNTNIYLLLFVDDILICGQNKIEIQNLKLKLSNRFKIKDLGKINTYIGIKVDYLVNSKEMSLNQTSYIESLAIKYNILESKIYQTPMETNLKLYQSENVDFNLKYRNLIGALLYISTGTRPDISFSVNFLSRFQNCYDKTHYKYALRVLKYLYHTKDLKLTFNFTNSCNNEMLDCFVDSDWASDVIDRKSTFGYLIRFYGNIIFWKTHKQHSVTKSSTFAEYVALSEAVTEIITFKELLKVFNLHANAPIKIYEDNSGAVQIAKNGNLSKNSKHIEIHYSFVHDNCNKGEIKVLKIKSDENLADILTKSICKQQFIKLRTLINVN